jgi:hypothetical protein
MRVVQEPELLWPGLQVGRVPTGVCQAPFGNRNDGNFHL